MFADSSIGLSDLGTPALIALGVVGLVEVAFIIWGLYDIWAGRKAKSQPWLWTIVVIVLNWIGVVVYLAAGRRPAAPRPTDHTPDGGPARGEDDEARSRRAEDAVDTLYGGKQE